MRGRIYITFFALEFRWNEPEFMWIFWRGLVVFRRFFGLDKIGAWVTISNPDERVLCGYRLNF